MLCRKFRHTLFVKSTLNNNVQYCLLKPRLFSKRCILDGVFATVSKSEGIRMSSIRFVLKDLSIARLWSAWSRSFIVNNVVRRVKRDRCVREVFDRFRQTIFKPRRTFLLAATAAFKGKGDDSSESPPSCQQNITDDDLEALLTELEGVEKLSQATLFCTSCGKRLVIDKKQPGVRCKESQALEDSSDGWVPYMEVEDVIIWRKEYKPGQGLYAYKVYGRYKEVQAADFAAVQVDGAYRRAWDAAVAALALVERRANGVSDQAVLHWEVLWPRLFANRDYVYIRRHKEFTINSPPLPHKDGIFTPSEPQTPPERPNVHSRAKQKSRDNERREMDGGVKENKVFIIVSRSCEHPKVPETKHAIRVLEYWSHMVVKTIDGPDKPGMEFVLTYYDEPAVGGLPTGVATWATGRAAPAYLERMRRAAAGYQAWSDARGDQDLPDFAPFGPPKPQDVCLAPVTVSEQDMESSKDGPDLDSGNGSETTRDQSTQTDDAPDGPTRDVLIKMTAHAKNDVKNQPEVQTKVENMTKKEEQSTPQEGDSDTPEEEESNNNGSWWRYLYPFYYFV
ncbi:uncharacterized protein LOC114351433 isoform X2 [Ostrinia furnacalis]|uniref:uncharacterized protein LOC114351433 isoform X2 n=1 Tax=Ostrinia furnacalis TaxID=93504 RepID=UPI001039A117|nr:uncharacterized protein LOC114351433 isoform X2 [Ostrinia furnacalis]